MRGDTTLRLGYAIRYLYVQMMIGTKSAIAFGAYLLSYLPARPTLLGSHVHGTGLEEATKVAVFSHFDRRGKLQRYVRHYLEEIRIAGFSIVFVTNSKELEDESLEALKGLCDVILIRRNVGYDFGAFKEGIAFLGRKLESLECLLLANDSVYGPFYSLRSITARMDFRKADAWAVVDSWERLYHLQSFFLLFSPKVLNDPVFPAFWRRVRNVRSKYWVIRRYEIPLSRALMKKGLRCRALNRSREASQALLSEVRETAKLDSKDKTPVEMRYRQRVFSIIVAEKPMNVSHFLWEHLIKQMGCPFLKRELLRKNPGRVPFVSDWESVIRKVSSYDTDLILEDLEYSLKNRSV